MAISAGTWAPISQIGLDQAINATSTTQTYKIGKRIRCRDSGSTDYGEAEFVYLKGVASTAVGDAVVFDGAGLTTRAVARSVGPVGVAMSANVASQWGWYQVEGKAAITATASVGANKQMYLTATAGSLRDTVVTGDVVYGCRSDAADDTGLVLAGLNNPHVGDTDNA